MARVLIEGFMCERCHHRWVPRHNARNEPKNCPKCCSPYLEQAPQNQPATGKARHPAHGRNLQSSLGPVDKCRQGRLPTSFSN